MATEVAAPQMSTRDMLRLSFTTLTHQERFRVIAMYGSIVAMHAAGFFVFAVFVVPAHYRGLGIGVSVLAYTLGLRHAFDADHISAIDNTTRKNMNERRGTDQPRPLGFGYFFSLGHSTIVVVIGVGIIIAEKTVFTAVSHNNSGLEQFGGVFGTIVSATFLFLIGALNLIVLAGIVKVFRSMHRGEYDEAALERQLDNRGFFYRFFGRWMKAIDKEWKMYPVGVLFGMGFDTASEVALLATTALYASRHVPWYAIICLPILFMAGMTLMDTTDGLFMNLAYGWAFFNPVRKVYYNLAITGLVGGDLLFYRRCGDARPHPDGGAQPEPVARFLGFYVQLQYQHGRLCDSWDVRCDLGRGHVGLALRPYRREMDGASPGGRRGSGRGRGSHDRFELEDDCAVAERLTSWQWWTSGHHRRGRAD